MVVATRTVWEEALWLSGSQVTGSAMAKRVKVSIVATEVALALPKDESRK